MAEFESQQRAEHIVTILHESPKDIRDGLRQFTSSTGSCQKFTELRLYIGLDSEKPNSNKIPDLARSCLGVDLLAERYGLCGSPIEALTFEQKLFARAKPWLQMNEMYGAYLPVSSIDWGFDLFLKQWEVRLKGVAVEVQMATRGLVRVAHL